MEKYLELRDIQLHLANMLSDVVDYLDKHEIRYYLIGGTLLGAVRHKGFIPWDDDIDLGIPRPDYDRFLELIKEEPIAPYYKVISDKDGNLSNPYAEVIDLRTRVEKDSEQYIREDCIILNLFIDIIPQDGWPSDDKAAAKLAKRMKRDRYLIQNARAKLGKGTSLKRIILKTPIILLMRIVGYKYVIAKMNKIARRFKYDEAEYVGALTFGLYGPGERCLREDIIQMEKVEFEGRIYNAPGGWDKYLTQIYGDYMAVPPEGKRISHKIKAWYID